jgi:hypothetical protein
MGGCMRLLSVFFTAALTMRGLVAVLGPAVAQERSTRQSFETREITGPENTPAPTPEQNTAHAQASAACPGAEVVGTAGPTDKDMVIGPFQITGTMFRLTYETTDADQSGFPFFDVTVLDAARNEVGGQVIFDEGTRTEMVRGGPGRFTIEARSEDLKYKITAEDCTGGGNPPPGGGGQHVPKSPIPRDQYKSDVNPPNENNVIDNTVSRNPLPNTGGVPLLGLGFFGFVFTFAAFALLRPAIRRDS